MVILWILLAIIGLLMLLVSVPVIFRIEWHGDEPSVKLKYLFISYTIYPTDREEPEYGRVRSYFNEVLEKLKKKRQERKRKKAETLPQKTEQPKKSGWQSLREQRGFWGAVRYLLRIVAESADLGAYLVRKAVISRCRLHISVGGEDAAAAAITQGQWCAAIYPVVSLILCSVRRYRDCSVNIVPDFLSEKNSYDIDVRIRVKPFHGITGALRMLISLVRAESSENQALNSLRAMEKASGNNDYPDNTES